jgi:transposase-like protein
MMTRERYSLEFKETLAMEIFSGQSTASKIFKMQ